jgi:hypothetical protein
MPQYKEVYLEAYLDEFKFLDPECHDVRVREINMRTKRCNRCQGFEECKMHPHFWLHGEPIRVAENEKLTSADKAQHGAYQAIQDRRYIPQADAPV